MNLTRNILRGILVLLIVLIFVYLNIKAEDNIELIAKFKFETLDTIESSSLDGQYKFDLLDNVTTRFSGQILEGTSHVREVIHYLIGIIGLLVVVEIGFLIAKRKRDRQTKSI